MTTTPGADTPIREALAAALAAAVSADSPRTWLLRGGNLAAANPTKIDTDRKTATTIATDVRAALTAAANAELVDYDPSYQPAPNQRLVIPASELPFLDRLHKLVALGDLPLDNGVGPLLGMVHQLGADATPVAAYRVTGPGIATKRPRGLRALLPRDGVYEAIDGDVIYYQPRFDVLVVAEFALVSTRTVLEQRLGGDQTLKEQALATLDVISATLDIAGLAELRKAATSDHTMMVKLGQVRRLIDSDPAYAAALHTERLLAFLDNHPDIDIPTAGQGSTRALSFVASPQQRYRLVKLLADDYLRSDLTNRQYEAGSKVAL